MKHWIQRTAIFVAAIMLASTLFLPGLNFSASAEASRVLLFEAASGVGVANTPDSYEVGYGSAVYNGTEGKTLQLKLTESGAASRGDWNKMNSLAAVFSYFHEQGNWQSIQAASYASGVFRFWVKSPTAMRFTVALQENSTWDFYLSQVEITETQVGAFVAIDVPLSSFKRSTNSIYTDEVEDKICTGQINKIYITCLRENTQWIEAGQALELGSVEFWDGTPPAAEQETPAVMVDQVPAIPVVYTARDAANYTVNYLDDVSYDGADDRTAALYTLTEAGAAAAAPQLQIDLRIAEAGWKSWYIADYPQGYLRIWVKAGKPLSFSVQVQETTTNVNATCEVYYDLTAEQTDRFVPMDIPFSALQELAVSDTSRINKIWLNPNYGDEKLAAGDTVTLGRIEYWNAEPPAVSDQPEYGIMTEALLAIPAIVYPKSDSYLDVEYREDDSYNGEQNVTSAVFTLSEASTAGKPRAEYNIRSDATSWKNWAISELSDYYLRLWVRADSQVTFEVLIQETSSTNATYETSYELTAEQVGDFAAIDIPFSALQEIAVADNSRINKIWINPNGGETLLTAGESFSVGRVELWNGKPEPPAEPSEPEEPDPTPPEEPVESVLLYLNSADSTDMWSEVWSGDGAPMEFSVESVPESDPLSALYAQTARFTLKADQATSYLNSGPGFRYIRIGRITGTAVGDLRDYMQTGTLRIRLSVPHDMKVAVGLLDQEYRGTFVDKEITAVQGYTVLDIPLSELMGDNVDYSQLREIRLRPASGTTASSNSFLAGDESLLIAGMEFWSGEPKERTGSAEELPGTNPGNFEVNHDTVGSQKLFECDFVTNAAWSDDFNDNSGDQRTVLIQNATLSSDSPYFRYFHTIANISLNPGREAAYYQKNYPIYFFGSTVYDTIKYERIPIDLSGALQTGTLRLYISVPRDMDIRIGVTDSKWNSVLLTRSFRKNDGFTEVCIPLSELAANARNVDFSKIVQIRMQPVEDASLENGKFLAAGETIILGPLQIWSKGAANIELPGPYDDLPAQSTEPTRKFFETEYLRKNCWSDDWNTGGDRMVRADTVMLDSDDPNYYRFQRAVAISLNPDRIAEYYEKKYPVAFFGQNGTTDLLPYIMNGTVRFWVKSTRAMDIDLAISDQDYHILKVTRHINKTDDYVEVQVPLKEFYYTAWENGIVFDWTQFSHFRVYPVTDATVQNGKFLLRDDVLTFGYVQIWTGEAPEPTAEEIDVTRTFYDVNSGAFIKDYDLSLMEGTELRFYRITAERELEAIRSRIGSQRKLEQAYMMLVLTNGMKVDSALGDVDVYLPITETFPDDIRFAVMNDNSECIAAETRTEDGYLVVKTSDFGRLIAYTGPEFSDRLEAAAGVQKGPSTAKVEAGGQRFPLAAGIIGGVVAVIAAVTVAVILIRKKKAVKA